MVKTLSLIYRDQFRKLLDTAMFNKILVLGATGNVGYPLAQMLKNRNADFCIGIKPESELPESMKDIESVHVDYDDISTVQAALTNVENLFILIPDSPLMVDQMANINTAILDSSVARYVYISGAGVKIAPDTWLSQNLLRCEELLRSNDLPGTILRPTFFMQNFLNHYPPSDNQMHLPVGNGIVNYIDVNDVASAACEILIKDSIQKGVEVFHLTGKESFDMYEIAMLFSKKLKKHYEYIPISLEESKQVMTRNNLPDWLINMLQQIYKKVSENLYAFYSQDLQFLTGKEPRNFSMFIEKNRFSFE
ncbi:NmrA family NAD(P)-binding protein [Ekhidna sp.]